MAAKTATIFTTIRTEGALLPADLLQRISEGATLDGLTPESYHRPGEKLNEAINRSWNALQGVWASFRAAQERLPENDLGTSITRERWLLPLFRELDYGRLQTATAVEIDGRSYPISHNWEHVPVHLVSYKLELDRRTPGAAGAASASPHSLLQVFLNRSDDHLWGFLSNGYKLRILRDNATLTRQAYVEFDLEAMMDGEVYSDFVLLWLLCHQSRVEGEKPSDCWLEKWMKVAEDQGTRALDQLRDGVEAAITALGLGFLEYPANHALRDKLTTGELSAQDYYRQLLRMVYRLLFLFVAEDRDLLLNPAADDPARERYVDYYSTRRLRRMAETFNGTRHPDLFEGLRLVMQLLSGEALTPSHSPSGRGERQVSPPEGERFREGAAGLGLVPLGSFLFSDRAVTDIIGCQIANSHLLTAVRALSLTYDTRAQIYRTVDYKNLGSDELGSIFESLLELHPQINVPARRFALSTAAGNERKTTGSYYTPESLVHALLDSALNPVLDEAIRGTGKARPPTPASSGGAESVREMATKAMRDIARDLRQRQTLPETILWEALRQNRLGGLGFRRQHPIANTSYVVDFFCYAANLIVELDGGIHQFQQKADSQRQSELESLGYRILRFPNQRVTDDFINVLIEILNTAHEQVPPPAGAKSPHLRGGDLEGGLTAEQRILDLKVCDPACGSGHFLIAAANRMAKALAFVRTGEEEPPPAAVQEAKRDIISHCIYGVDINPMAVELCKVNLWMEALEPGKPLNFLDHRIQVGNSLLGTTPKLMAAGIPDDAFNPIEGDDPKYAATLKKLNKQERKDRETGQRSMFELIEPPADYTHLTAAMHALDSAPDDTLDQIRRKEAQFAALANDPEYIKARLLADAWCAAFVWPKGAAKQPQSERSGDPAGKQNGLPLPMTDLLYRRMEDNPLADNLQPVREYVVELKERYQFFHWHVAFPDVFTVPDDLTSAESEQTGWLGGFDCVLGNPPWDQIQLDDREFFAVSAPEIANAANMSARKKMLAQLAKDDPNLHNAYLQALRANDAVKHFAHASGRYPFTSFGRLNTAPLFCELGLNLVNPQGYSALIVPTGIATDSFNQYFFNHIVDSGSLRCLYDFENRLGLFPAVDSRMKFCLLVLNGSHNATTQMQFAFFAHDVSDLAEITFSLSPEDIALLNPNTRTTPIFRTKRDADLTRKVYQTVPVLIDEIEELSSWSVDFRLMFMMNAASDKFLTLNDLANSELRGNCLFRDHEIYLPLYEGKMINMFDHRAARVVISEQAAVRQGQSEYFTIEEHQAPNLLAMPRYWVAKRDTLEVIPKYHDTSWLMGFKDVTSVTNERTVIASVIPFTAVGHTLPVVYVLNEARVREASAFLTNLNSFVLDYIARQKVGGNHLTFGYMKQLPVIPPHTYTPPLLDFIVPRVLELTYTAWDLQPFAQDVGYDGAPFVWDEERRFLMRCELDALYFHLYQIPRDDVDYIMETFPIVKRKDEAAHGEYLTKRIILEMVDQMAALPTMPVPAPKSPPLPQGISSPPRHEGEGDLGGEGLYAVPDVSHWQTWLTPPPADPSVAHPSSEV